MSKSNRKRKIVQNIVEAQRKNKSNGTKLVDLSCSHCGGDLSLVDKENAVCPHCGAKYLIEQPEDVNINIYLNDSDNNKSNIKKKYEDEYNYKKQNQFSESENTNKSAFLKFFIVVCAAIILIFVIDNYYKDNNTDSSRSNIVMAQFCHDVLGKEMKDIKTEDLEKVKYIEPYEKNFDGQNNSYYQYKYSLYDYSDYEDIQDFIDTIQTWKSGPINAGERSNYLEIDKFTGLTAVKVDLSDKILIPKNANVTCVFAIDLDDIKKQIENNSSWNKDELKCLYLSKQRNDDITLLKEFPNLEYLKIEGYDYDPIIPDLNILAGCTKLKALDLSFADAYLGVNALSNLHELKKLYITKVNIETASFLLDMPELEYLHIDVDDENSLDNLKNLTKLKDLSLTGGKIHISELPDQKELTRLTCCVKAQEDVDSLARFDKLEYLYLKEDYLFTDISVKEIGKLENLKEVYLGGFFGASYSDMEAIINLPNIEILRISHGAGSERKTVVINPELLNEESNLKEFKCYKYVFYNSSTLQPDWSFCSVLKNVEEMTLFKCNLEDISFLSGLSKLQIIDLEQNAIKDYSPLKNCKALTTVYTWGNTQIDANIGNGVEVIPKENIDSSY